MDFSYLISFSVAKRIAPTDNAHDLNLNSLLYVMYGRRKRDSGKGELFSHETGPGEIPKLSNEPLNPLTLSAALDDSFPTSILLQTHGIIMIITWSMLAATGIFFAAWMRQALPKGEWFQVNFNFIPVLDDVLSSSSGPQSFSSCFTFPRSDWVHPSICCKLQQNSTWSYRVRSWKCEDALS